MNNAQETRREDIQPTGRSASFYCPVEKEQDIEAVAQRVAQFVAVGWQRGELDGVKIKMMEAEIESEESRARE